MFRAASFYLGTLNDTAFKTTIMYSLLNNTYNVALTYDIDLIIFELLNQLIRIRRKIVYG